METFRRLYARTGLFLMFCTLHVLFIYTAYVKSYTQALVYGICLLVLSFLLFSTVCIGWSDPESFAGMFFALLGASVVSFLLTLGSGYIIKTQSLSNWGTTAVFIAVVVIHIFHLVYSIVRRNVLGIISEALLVVGIVVGAIDDTNQVLVTIMVLTMLVSLILAAISMYVGWDD